MKEKKKIKIKDKIIHQMMTNENNDKEDNKDEKDENVSEASRC